MRTAAHTRGGSAFSLLELLLVLAILLILTVLGGPDGAGGKEMRTPGNPDPSSAVLPPGAWKMQNMPVSSVIR